MGMVKRFLADVAELMGKDEIDDDVIEMAQDLNPSEVSEALGRKRQGEDPVTIIVRS